MKQSGAVAQKIEEIEKDLQLRYERRQIYNGNVSSGDAGLVLFYYHLYLFSKNEEHLRKCEQVLSSMLENYIFQKTSFSHCSGQAGINWLIGYLIKHKVLTKKDYDIVRETDSFLVSVMEDLLKKGFYDFLHQGLGILFCLLETPITKKEKEGIIEKAVSLLEASAAKNSNEEVYWWEIEIMERRLNQGVCNLGLSHGLPSIIGVLAKALPFVSNNSLRKKIVNLIEGTARFIVQQKSSKAETSSLYPFNITLDAEPNYASRLAWCYGDLGVAVSLWHAFEATGNSGWKAEALAVMDKAAGRTILDASQVRDGGICHGSSGVAQIFRAFYKHTQNKAYLDAADYWIEQTLLMSRFEDGSAGFKAYTHDKGYINIYGFLEGTIGIGLVLMAALDPQNDDWSRFWLIS